MLVFENLFLKQMLSYQKGYLKKAVLCVKRIIEQFIISSEVQCMKKGKIFF